MPNRYGKSMKKKQDREQHRQEPVFKDKTNARTSKDCISPIDWFSDDNDDDDDDTDQFPPKDYYTSDKYKTTKTRKKVAKQPSVISKCSSQSPDINLIEEHLNGHQLPSEIFKIFPNAKSKKELLKILKSIQDEEDRYWHSKDEKVCSRQAVIEYFQQMKYADFKQENGKQIVKYLHNPILRKSQYGVLLFNSERQIFVVQNQDDTWNAPMSYRKIDDSYQLETIIETVSRAFNGQVCAKHQLTDEIFECYDLRDDQHLDSHKYIEKQTENSLIGLFISEFDRPIIEFELHNMHAEACQWISIDDISNQNFCEQFDRYRTLRPFVQYICDLQQRSTENEAMYENNLNNTVDAISTINLKADPPLRTPLCIRDEIFDCAQLPIEFRDEVLDESLATVSATNYVPTILAVFNLSSKLPKDHMSIPEYNQCVLRTLQVPYYKKPNVNIMFPSQSHRRIFGQPKKISILPLLIIAQRNQVSIQNYDIISERNSFRKIAMNNENYVIGVKRIGTTLFLRRHDQRSVNKNDVGSRFEQMCRPNYRLNAEFKLLVENYIGNLRTLITAETDVVCEQTNQPIELKSRLNTNKISQPIDRWFQAFLSGAQKVIVGHRTADEPPLLVDIREYDTSTIVGDRAKERVLLFLYRVLYFLRDNVQQDGTYLLSRRYDARVGKRSLYLYKVADKHEQELTFVTSDLLKQLNFNL